MSDTHACLHKTVKEGYEGSFGEARERTIIRHAYKRHAFEFALIVSHKPS